MLELKEYTKFNIMTTPGFFDIAVSFAVRMEKLLNYESPVETQTVGFSDVEWKLKFSRHTIAIPSVTDEEIGNIDNVEIIRCHLLASASMTDDWTCTLNKHCLAWKPYNSTYKYYRDRPASQFKVAGRRLLDGFQGFFNVSLSGDGDECSDNSYLSIRLDDAVQYAGPSKWLVCEMYIRGVGPITLYPTYLESYDFGTKNCVTLRLMGQDNDPKTFKAPVSRLKKESRYLNAMLQNETTSIDLEDIEADTLDFRMFLQCLMWPYMPLDKCSIDTVKEVIRLACICDCPTLQHRCVEYIIETSELTVNEKIAIGNSFNMPIVVLYALEAMDGDSIAAYIQSDDYKNLNYENQVACTRRCRECNEA